jgi:hypothetical protein
MLAPVLTPPVTPLHTRKAHNGKRARVEGVWLLQRNGQRAYLAYPPSVSLTYVPSQDDAPEQVQCRLGDSGFTLEGRNLQPLLEPLTRHQCASLQETDSAQGSAPGVPSIERLTARLWV